MLDLRIRGRVGKEELAEKVGKVLGPEDYNLLLTGPTRVRMPDNRPLCVYLPGVMAEEFDQPGVYDVLHSLRVVTTNNRGVASGAKPVIPNKKITAGGGNPRKYSRKVASTVVGALDPQGQRLYCRLSSWTGRNMPEWQRLTPLFQTVAEHQMREVPDRAAAQWEQAKRSDPFWIVPGTPFSTITVNNTYPTGVHTDKGDLEEGFSAIACARYGSYTGGQLVFPEFRVAVDLRHGDLILMDAHQWHGNTQLTCACGTYANGACGTCGAERISVVTYFRTEIVNCSTPEVELQRAEAQIGLR